MTKNSTFSMFVTPYTNRKSPIDNRDVWYMRKTLVFNDIMQFEPQTLQNLKTL